MTDSVELVRDMAVTHDEFYRLIRKTIVDSDKIKIDSNKAMINIPFANGHVDIRLDKQQTRKIASLSISHTLIHFDFVGLSKKEIESYMQKFDMTFQKGGG
mgnify:CR=1 FL=1